VDSTRTAIDELAAEYDRLREALRQVLAAPVKDLAAASRLMDRLDAVHMAYKEAHGLHGNNPND
jgi:hypothetical protein